MGCCLYNPHIETVFYESMTVLSYDVCLIHHIYQYCIAILNRTVRTIPML